MSFVVTAEGGRWNNLDREEVLRAFALLFAPGGSHELRALPSARSRLVSADMPDVALAAAQELAEGARGLYYTLNPVDPANGDRAAKNGDVTGRRWMLVDVDPVKADKDCSSTDAEKAAAWAVATAVVDGLMARGWPEPVVVDSGNGYHLLYLLSLPNDDRARKLVAGCLKALAAAHDTEGAKVDRGVHNASRVAKLPGTWARKGREAPDRPHRLCKVVWAPSPPLPVPVAAMVDLAGVEPEKAPEAVASPFVVQAADDGRKTAYVKSALLQELARVAMAPEGERNNALNRAAFSLGTLLGSRELSRGDVEQQLTLAARRAGLSEQEIRETIRSGLDSGAAAPRAIPDKASRTNGRGPVPPEFGPDGLPCDEDVQTLCMEDVEAVPVEWLMPGRIPLGKITLLAGLAKQGKSFFTMDLAARVSAGDVIPCGGGECFERGSVVLLSAEDDPNDTIKPRLVRAGADARKIHALTTVRQPDGRLGPFTLAYVPHLEKAVLRLKDCRLVIIDPVTHYVGGKIDDHKVAQLRAVLDPLKELAMRRKVAVLVISHLNKGGGGNANALHRVIGSSAYTALARANWMIIRDPKEPARRLFLDAGTNLVEDPLGLAFRIKDGRIEWEEKPVHMTANEALAAEAEAKKEETKVDRGPNRAEKAKEWLEGLFAHAAEIPSEDLFTKGIARGISRDALYEAKKELGIKATKVRGAWVWRLPALEPVTNGFHDPPF